MADVSVGSILSATFDTVKSNLRAGVLYVAVLTAFGSGSDYLSYSSGALGYGSGALGLAVAAVTIVAGYLLTEAMLSQSGQLTYHGSKRYFAYLGQAILIIIGVVLGVLLLVIPGLILAARWALAAPLLIGRGAGVIDAIRESWQLTRGHTLPIIIAGFILLVPVFALAGIGGVFSGEGSLVMIITAQLISSAFTVIITGMVVSLLTMLDSSPAALSEVFG